MDSLEQRPAARSDRSSSTPAELVAGAAVFQNKNCRNCHAVDGVGGRRGPDLSGIGVRMTADQLIDQVSNGTPGGGNMPAFGKQINPAEMTTLVGFLVSLRPKASRRLGHRPGDRVTTRPSAAARAAETSRP